MIESKAPRTAVMVIAVKKKIVPLREGLERLGHRSEPSVFRIDVECRVTIWHGSAPN
jgi:hypothetical protein